MKKNLRFKKVFTTLEPSWEWHTYFSYFTPYKPIFYTFLHTTVACLRSQSLGLTPVAYKRAMPPIYAQTKGQIISKANYRVLKSSKKGTKYLPKSILANRTEIFASFFGRIANKYTCF